MLFSRKSILIFSLQFFCAMSNANEYREQSLEKKVEKSSLVGIGVVVGFADCGQSVKCAEVNIIRRLKGAPKENVIVLFDGTISEMKPHCCELQKTYLFFLGRRADGKYYSANGPYGIYEIPIVRS